jgi:hypothetical protein
MNTRDLPQDVKKSSSNDSRDKLVAEVDTLKLQIKYLEYLNK